MKRTILAALMAASLVSLPMIGLAAAEQPSATIELNGGTVGVGVGVDWAKGTLHYEGQDIPVSVKGLSIANVGAGKISASGNVYHLRDVKDFAGNYSAVSAGAALAGGGGVSAMRNDKGVVMQLKSTTTGVELDLGVKGLEVTVDR